jgi:uncharacterized protein DUF4255
MIRAVTETLVDVIHQSTPDLGDWVAIHSLNSTDGVVDATKAALALLAVAPHPHLVNRPLVERAAGLVRAPLALRLQYLITVFGDHDEAQTKIERILQVFHTTPIIARPMLQPPLSAAVESVTVRLMSPSAEERNQIWSTLGRPGRLALYYEVDVAPVEVIEREGAGRVRTHRVGYEVLA